MSRHMPRIVGVAATAAWLIAGAMTFVASHSVTVQFFHRFIIGLAVVLGIGWFICSLGPGAGLLRAYGAAMYRAGLNDGGAPPADGTRLRPIPVPSRRSLIVVGVAASLLAAAVVAAETRANGARVPPAVAATVPPPVDAGVARDGLTGGRRASARVTPTRTRPVERSAPRRPSRPARSDVDQSTTRQRPLGRDQPRPIRRIVRDVVRPAVEPVGELLGGARAGP